MSGGSEMERKEAITILAKLNEMFRFCENEDVRGALDMAISALSAEPKYEDKAEVMRIIEDAQIVCHWNATDDFDDIAENIIEQTRKCILSAIEDELPLTVPTNATENSCTEPSDLISRAEAIDAVCQGCAWYNTASCENSREWKCDEIIRIMDLPSVSVESKATENKYDCDLISRIVRCKDCEYYDNGENEVDSWEMCKRNLHSTSQYDFCSWAKMKGGTK